MKQPIHGDLRLRANEIERAIGNADYDKALRRLVVFVNDFSDDPNLRNEAIALHGRFKADRREARTNQISNDELRRRLSDVSMAVLQLLAEIPASDKGSLEGAQMQFPSTSLDKAVYVSYAWADETDPDREALVDRLLKDAEALGVSIKRDKSSMHVGERISEFMGALGAADRIIIFLSAKYLRSPFCMYELFCIWMEASGRESKFSNRIAVYALDDARVWTIKERAECARFWQEQYSDNEPHLSQMGERDRIAHLNMKKFSVHVGDILATIADTVLPQSYEELRTFAFD